MVLRSYLIKSYHFQNATGNHPLRHWLQVSRTHIFDGTDLAPRKLISAVGLTLGGCFGRGIAPANELFWNYSCRYALRAQ